jgi:hypothetical protein
VIIGDRLRDMREQKKLSQGDIRKEDRSASVLHFASRK